LDSHLFLTAGVCLLGCQIKSNGKKGMKEYERNHREYRENIISLCSLWLDFSQYLKNGKEVKVRKSSVIFTLLILFFSTYLYAEEKEEIASIKEIVEVKKSIVIPKDPVIASLYAVSIPGGLGQVYCGKYWRAAGVFISEIGLAVAGAYLRGEQQEDFTYAVIDSATGETVYLKGKKTVKTEKSDQQKLAGNTLIVTAIGIHIWSIFDAYRQANIHNRDMIKRPKKETGFNLKLKEDGIGLAFYKNF